MSTIQLTDKTMQVLEKSLDLRSRNQQVIAANIANVETPGYQTRRLSFEDDLRRAMDNPQLADRQLNRRHFPVGDGGIAAVQGKLIKEPDLNPLGDGNNVSMDEQMFDLAENQLLFEAGSQMLKKKFAMLKFVAADGR